MKMDNECFDVFEESDSNALILRDGAIQILPILLKENAPFVHFADSYVSPEQIPSFERIEKKPEYRKQSVKATQIDFDATVCEAQRPSQPSAPSVSIRERLAGAQKKWAEEKRTEAREEN
jgi:hypothetical protein